MMLLVMLLFGKCLVVYWLMISLSMSIKLLCRIEKTTLLALLPIDMQCWAFVS